MDACKKVKTGIAVCETTSPLQEITYYMGSHSVTCRPAEVNFLPLSQTKLVLNLATPNGWMVVVTSQDSLPCRECYLTWKITGSVMTGIRTHDCESQVRHPNHYTTYNTTCEQWHLWLCIVFD